MEHTTNPLDEQEIFCVKDRIPELDTEEFAGPFAKVHQFNGVALEASSKLVIGGKTVAENVLMKPNCACAISQSNKRYLEGFNMYTDYIEPNPLLFRALGFSENESKVLVYVKGVDDLPLDAIVTAYNLDGDKTALPEPLASFALKNGMKIAYEEAVKILADWLVDNGYASNHYEEFMEYEDINDAWEVASVSAEAKAYAEEMEEEPWEQLEIACLYECAVTMLEDMALASVAVYTILEKKYAAAGLIAASMQLSWGLDDEADLVLCDEVGTTDNTLIVSRDLYDKNGTLDSMINAPVLKYFESIGYDITSDDPVQEIPEDVLDEISDTYMYLAEAICDDLAFDIHM